MSRDGHRNYVLDGKGLRFGIVAARFNEAYVEQLLESVLATLKKYRTLEEDIELIRVPGSNEIPYAINEMGMLEEFDCLIAIGLVLAGETPHHEIIAHATATELQRLASNNNTPVINGIIVVNTEEQAKARCGKEHDRGTEFGRAALEMAGHKEVFEERIFDMMDDALDDALAMDHDDENDDLLDLDPTKDPEFWKKK